MQSCGDLSKLRMEVVHREIYIEIPTGYFRGANNDTAGRNMIRMVDFAFPIGRGARCEIVYKCAT